MYNWFIEQLGIFPSQQIEFDRLNITYTLLSKRKLLTLVQEGHVAGWDDPRMPTLSGMRRRGYTPEAIRNFCANLSVSKTNNTVQLSLLEHFVREDLNKRAARVMAVLRPLRVVIDNYPDDLVEEMDAVNNPEDESMGTRKVPFSKVLYIEQDDFREDPPKQFFRLAPGREVRLRYGYLITCKSVVKDADGNVVELHCTYDPATRGGNTPDGRKVKSTIHWVSAAHAVDCEVRLYDNLFTKENPNEVEEGQDFTANLNPNSLEVLSGCKVEPSLRDAAAGTRYQFERLGYFCVDPDSASGKLVFNRTIGLRDTWAKIEQREKEIDNWKHRRSGNLRRDGGLCIQRTSQVGKVQLGRHAPALFKTSVFKGPRRLARFSREGGLAPAVLVAFKSAASLNSGGKPTL